MSTIIGVIVVLVVVLVLAMQAWRLTDVRAADAAWAQLQTTAPESLQVFEVVEPRSWTRFWLFWTLPVVRAGDDANHLRSALGRVVAEAAFWAPAALLPQNGVRWEEGAAPDRARAVVTHGSFVQRLEIAVAEDGRPLWVKLPRWSNVNPERQWRQQPFGGTLGNLRTFQGFTLPTKVDVGNHFGTNEYFPFFRARVEDVRFAGHTGSPPSVRTIGGGPMTPFVRR
jgi:hypothetical protein